MGIRTLNARRLAKAKLAEESEKKTKKKKKKDWDDVPIQKLDIETGEIVKEFTSFDEVIKDEGLNASNLIGALKNGTKYKGFYWKIVNEKK